MFLSAVELGIVVLANSTNVEGRSFTVNEGHGLPNPIDCSVRPNVTNFNAVLQWKHNMTIDVLSYASKQPSGIYQVYENNQRRLYVTSADGPAHGLYSCQYTANGAIVSESFRLNVNGKASVLLDEVVVVTDFLSCRQLIVRGVLGHRALQHAAWEFAVEVILVLLNNTGGWSVWVLQVSNVTANNLPVGLCPILW